MIFITDDNEIKYTKVLALYFYAPWMPFHKKMLEMIKKVEEQHPSINFLGIDTDSFKGTCKRFNVDSIPTVIIFWDGKGIKRITGLVMTSAFKSIFNDIIKAGEEYEREKAEYERKKRRR